MAAAKTDARWSGRDSGDARHLHAPDYDLAGFVVGCVEEDAILGADRVEKGDVIIGLASSGLHTNGYSLARRIVAERLRLAVSDPFLVRTLPSPMSCYVSTGHISLC